MGPKFSDKCQTQRRRPCEDSSRDGSDAVTSQGMSGATRRRKEEGRILLQILARA